MNRNFWELSMICFVLSEWLHMISKLTGQSILEHRGWLRGWLREVLSLFVMQLWIRFASCASFHGKLIQQLVGMNQTSAVKWFKNNLTGKDGTWMLCHSGLGNSNTNCSAKVFWRIQFSERVPEADLGISYFDLLLLLWDISRIVALNQVLNTSNADGTFHSCCIVLS